MKNPFKVGDTIHHPTKGKGKVVNIDESSAPVRIHWCTGDVSWHALRAISFKPWPEPCHERPFEPVLKTGDKVVVMHTQTHISTIIVVLEETQHYVISNAGNKYAKTTSTFHRVGDAIQFN